MATYLSYLRYSLAAILLVYRSSCIRANTYHHPSLLPLCACDQLSLEQYITGRVVGTSEESKQGTFSNCSYYGS